MSPADQYGSQLDVLAHVNAKAKRPAPDDWCYVNNFKDAYHPKAVRLGRQRPRICAGYEEFVKVARWSFLGRSSENYEKNEINEVVQRRRGPLTELSTRRAISGSPSKAGGIAVPLTGDGRPCTRDEYDNPPDDRKQEIAARRKAQEAPTSSCHARALEAEAQDSSVNSTARSLFAVGLLEDLRARYRSVDGFGDCEAILSISMRSKMISSRSR